MQNKTVSHKPAATKRAAGDKKSKAPASTEEPRCWLCNADSHLASRCEKRCRGARCGELSLRTHSWAECPFKTKPFCQLCGETDHGVFARDCINRCCAHDRWVHHVDDCPTRCDDCGGRGHMARSPVCSLRRDRRPRNLLEVAAFKRVVEIAPPEPQAQPQPQVQVQKAPVSPKKAQQQKPQQQAAAKRKEAEDLKAKKEKEEQMKKALLELEKEKERIMKELAQLQESADKKPIGRELVKPGQAGRKALRQSRG